MAAYGGAAPYRSREGLSTRPVASSDEIQLRIDPMQGDLDNEIDGLRGQVRRLRNVAEDIRIEARFQNDFINQLATNDTDQSSSRSKEQRKEIEQKHHSEWLKQCCPCGCFRASLLFLWFTCCPKCPANDAFQVPRAPQT